jgi:protein TonB
MKKNRMFWGMLLFSAALHGLAFIGTAGIGFRAPPPVSEVPLVSTVKMIRTRPPAHAPSAPSPPVEKKPIKRPAESAPELPPEPLPEPPPVEETAYSGEEAGTEEAPDGADSGEAPENGATATEDGGTITGREYEALLAYIKDFIAKNLVYPPMARRRNVEGIVGVSFEIDGNGAVSSITVNHSSGSSILDNAAVSLVKKIKPLENMTIKRKLALEVNIDYELTE